MIRSRRPVLAPLLASAVALAACGRSAVSPSCGTAVDSIALSPAGALPDADTLILVRLGGVRQIDARFLDDCHRAVTVQDPSSVTWSSADPDVASAGPVQGAARPAGFVTAVGFGTTTVSASVGAARAELGVTVLKPATEADGFTVLGGGSVAPATTDLWVHGDYAYTGTEPWTCGDPCTSPSWLYAWHLQADGGVTKTDSLELPAPRLNDVKVSADGSFAVVTQELGSATDNGITLLDLSNPAAPSVIAHYSAGLEAGVHNVWIERIAGRDYVFAVSDQGDAAQLGVHILDVTDRTAPVQVALFVAPGHTSFPHDVYVRDGLAFVSHWDDGLYIVDVGNGVAGGSPADPVVVGHVATAGGHTHNAWYWPGRGLVFVGEERFPPPELIEQVGVVHVVDVSDMAHPVEVAQYGVAGSSPHNFWVDESRGVIFAAWYINGLRAIDVSGTLSGDLTSHGVELGHVIPSGPRGGASIWAPQLHNGRVYLSDIYNGIWSVSFDR